jgi:hypothetical protein
MIYNFFQHAIFWLFFTGFFLGVIGALLTTRPDRQKNPQKFRQRRPAKIYFFLSGAVVCITVALFVSAPGGLPARFFFALISGIVFTGLGLRFKKAAGIPLLILFVAALVFGGKAFADWNTTGKTVPAAEVLVLSSDENGAVLSFTPTGAAETIVRASWEPGAGVSVKTDILRIHPAYPVFGVLPLYRIQALASSGQDHLIPLPEPSAWEKAFLDFPGVRIETRESPLPPLSLFSSYKILFDPSAEDLVINKKP